MVCACSVVSNSLRPHGFFCPWDFPVKKTGANCHFLIQGWNPPLLHLHVSFGYDTPYVFALLNEVCCHSLALSIQTETESRKTPFVEVILWRTIHLPNRWSTLEMSNFNITPKWDVKELFPCTIKGKKRLGRPWTFSLIRWMVRAPITAMYHIDLWHSLSKPVSDHVCFPCQYEEQAG